MLSKDDTLCLLVTFECLEESFCSNFIHLVAKTCYKPYYFHIDVGARPRTGAEDPRMVRMSQQVKEVLPDVPLSVITRDLCKTPFSISRDSSQIAALISTKRHNQLYGIHSVCTCIILLCVLISLPYFLLHDGPLFPFSANKLCGYNYYQPAREHWAASYRACRSCTIRPITTFNLHYFCSCSTTYSKGGNDSLISHFHLAVCQYTNRYGGD